MRDTLLRSVFVVFFLSACACNDISNLVDSALGSHTTATLERGDYARRFIIVFKQIIDGAAPATTRLLQRLRAERRVQGGASVATTNSKSAEPLVDVVSILGAILTNLEDVTETSVAKPAAGNVSNTVVGAVQAARHSAAGEPFAATGVLQGVVLQLLTDGALLQSLLDSVRTSADVQAVIPDREVTAAVQQGTLPAPTTASVKRSSSCIEPRFLSQGVPGTLTSTAFKWPGCYTPRTQLLWLGRRCGTSRSQIEYTGVLAVDPQTGGVQQSHAGTPCVMLANSARGAWHRQRFGRCGSAPLYAAGLPTRVCSATGGTGDPACLQAAAAAAALQTAGSTVKSVPAFTDSEQSEAAAAGSLGSTGSTSGPAVTKTIAMQITLRHPVQCGGEFSHELSYSGGSCGPNNSLIRWTAATTPRGCRLRPRAEGSAAHAQLANVRFNQAIFGSCGVPPGNATAAIPIDICTEAPVPDTGDSPSPTNQPPSPAAPGIEPPTSPPQTPSGAQVPLAPNERVPSGVSRIGAATSGGVLNTLGRPVADQVVVGVVDSGVDGTHPDINVIGGKSWVLAGPTAEDAAASESDALTDPYGHGTHVAGSVAARYNGNGIVGVSPGTPVYSLRVLDAAGRGSLSNVISAMNWVITQGVTTGIKVINLSLAAYVDPASDSYRETVDVVCSVFQQVSDAGIMIVTAAGNYNSNLQGYLPAACPSVAAVTAVNADGSAPASFSNWIPDSTSEDAKSNVIAAPGTDILSTTSYARDSSGYRVLSGTSMAAPHVAGAAANCILFGACSSPKTGAEKLAVIQALARQHANAKRESLDVGKGQAGRFGFQGDGSSPVDGKYVGFLVWGGWPGRV